MILEVDGVSKTFGGNKAVQNISLNVPKARICGFLGPNGAGKTTLIRMIMDILKPDSGHIRLAAGLGDNRKMHIGYLPEERGLYTKTKVHETLVYFAMLKGLSKGDAKQQADRFLERLSMTAVADSVISKLSKGNQQKIQLIGCMLTQPKLLILDEPFSGLDPVNVKLVSELLTDLRNEGTSIMLSTHHMAQAEAFCQDIFLFNKGKLILQGELDPIIRSRSGSLLLLQGEGALPADGPFELLKTESRPNGERHYELLLHDGVSTRDMMAWLSQQPFQTQSLTPYRMPLGDIFIQEVSRA